MVCYCAGRSRWRGRLSSRAARILLLPVFCLSATAFSQDARQGAPPESPLDPIDPVEAEPPPRIDLLTQTRETMHADEYEDCTAEQEAAIIAGEILVCRRKRDQEDLRYSSPEDAKNRYARETMHAGDRPPVDVAGAGIFKGEPTVGSLCIPGLQKCPPPPAIVVDFDALPEAPPGSDADRIGRGLPPRGIDDPEKADETPPSANPAQPDLDLPPVPDFSP